MNVLKKKLVKKATSQIGTKEPTLDDKYIIWYNKLTGAGLSLLSPWCAIFVSWVAAQCKLSEYIPPFASCSRMVSYFQSKGQYETRRQRRNPEAGDIIFYDWDEAAENGADHVGIVEKVTGTMLTVIEGNYSDCVKRRFIDRSSVMIAGYAVPDYPSGDVNGDGKTDAQDALAILQTAVGKSPKATKKKADVNGDGKVDAADALEVLKDGVDK